jgi:hypothetical protein
MIEPFTSSVARRARALATIPLLLLTLQGGQIRAAGWDRDPIHYSTAPADNRLSRLESKIASGELKLTHEGDPGHLRSLLKALDVPESSQVLVFSKTSLQRNRIGPATPRAIYFNDDVFIGYCQRGDVLEIAAADPNLGTVFYTVGQKPGSPVVRRHTDNCLLCHGSSHTRGVPGHVVRSVTVESDGEISLAAGASRTDHTTPFDQRWGGWYVTGTHGKMTHHGNTFVPAGGEPDYAAGQNVTDLTGRFKQKPYLTRHSDIVALMVLEHQAGLHNRLAQATLEGRIALHHRNESTDRTIRELGDEIVDYLLFRNEAKLTDCVQGTSTFSLDFAKRGPFDRQGRSLRQFDLKTKLFKYPCSYLIYTDAFQKLPAEIKDHVLKRLYRVLIAEEGEKEFGHLSATDRRAIREILADTLPDKPAYWK